MAYYVMHKRFDVLHHLGSLTVANKKNKKIEQFCYPVACEVPTPPNSA